MLQNISPSHPIIKYRAGKKTSPTHFWLYVPSLNDFLKLQLEWYLFIYPDVIDPELPIVPKSGTHNTSAVSDFTSYVTHISPMRR